MEQNTIDSPIQGSTRIEICVIGSGVAFCGILSLWMWRSELSSSLLSPDLVGDLIEGLQVEIPRPLSDCAREFIVFFFLESAEFIVSPRSEG